MIAGGGVLQIVGVVMVLREISTARAKIRHVASTVLAVPRDTWPAGGGVFPRSRPSIEGLALEQRMSNIEADLAELVYVLDQSLRAMSDQRSPTSLQRAYEELATATAPHRWALWSAGAILLGVALSTLGGLLAL